ncbi:MAG: DUF4760 domain-containing protein [Rhodospirillaceae bacterium]|nr:DUF4760 domain-containing protein [Rhodospirillaceae bacterium]MBT3887469.1 DUF4760 domain-containing protein [Rhodospirillaceae bacterium]MBT4117350.1 DUF4760 domain-containing protein [Rhodospirillaceae bacterium]MBT4670798.1 DUF4760 domain-containing protein [Rhodospirillaceae bacterium]MBT4718817.1 DUF4760 domain-containing protein [Rhodospirillaceae bacterium]
MPSISLFQIAPVFLFPLALICFRGVLRPRHFVYIGVGILAYYVMYYLVRGGIEGENLWQLSIFTGTIFLSIGWIVSNEISILNSRKQHTINLISDYMINSQRIKDKTVIKKYLPKYTDKLTSAIMNFEAEDLDIGQAIDREINFFEFVAVGLETGDLDPNITERSIKSLAVNFYIQVEDYIGHWQSKDESTWEHFKNLSIRWNSKYS